MTHIDRLHELRTLKRNYLEFICFDSELKEVSDSFNQEIGNVSVEIAKIEEMSVEEAQAKIKFKTITIKSKI